MCVLNHFSCVWLFVALWTSLLTLLYPRDSSDENTGVGCPMPSSRGTSWPRDQTQVSCLLHWQMGSSPLATPRKAPPPPHTHNLNHQGRGPSLGAQMVKNLLVMQETRVQSLGWNNALEKGMAIHSSTLAWRIPWTEETGRLQSMGFQRLRHDWVTLSYDMVIMSPFIGSRVCISNDSELGHFTYVDQWAEVGMGLSHNLKMHCKIPLTLLRFSPFPKEEHTPDRH